MRSSEGQTLNSLDFLRFEVEIEHVQIHPHVIRVRGPGQRHHADIESEPENNLADRSAVALGNASQLRMGQDRTVRGEEGKTLINEAIGGTERAYIPIPA